MSIQEILESAGLPAQRGVYTGRDKPDAYYTFLRLLGTPAVNADDEEKERREMYRVTLFHKGDFEAQLDKTKEVLKAAGVETEVFFEVEADPTLSIVRKGAELANSFKPDVIIALGGGSPMDAAKIMWVMYEHPEADFLDMAMRFMDIRKRIYTFPKMGEKAYFVAISTSSGTGSGRGYQDRRL